MTRLLVYGPSYAPVAAEIERRVGGLDILVMDEGGAIRLDGKPVAAEDVRPDIVWFSGDLYMSKARGAFIGAVMAAPAIKWVQSAAAGFENPFFARIVSSGARLTTSHGQAVGIADFVLWGVLDAFKRGADLRAAQSRKAWREVETREILGSRWLIVGFGAIGQAVATRARAFGAHITGVRRNQAAEPLADRIAAIGDLPGLLPDADVVVLSAPLNAATRGLADATFFAAMKAGSVFANVGRGKSVDEAALLTALEAGAPAHAVLDVFENEPLPEASPLWSHPRVIVSPHCSGVTGGEAVRNAALFVDNLERYAAGRPLLNEADPKDVLGG